MPGLLFRNRRYRPVPQEAWTPQTLADELKKANVHNTAAKRLDAYEALVAQHQEDRKAKARMMLGMAGLVLGLAPAVPGTYRTCHHDPSWACALSLGALIGGALALTGTLWAAADLFNHPNLLSVQIGKLNASLDRAMHARNGSVTVDNLFDKYRSLSASDRRAFKEHLHGYAREATTTRWRAAAAGLGLDV